uniref:Uncharacterized protein n=1 Tax=Nelumbo nucifera TaxID=4432 RepID=A0A822ZI60_NELNU|nr:TPA_asm: hypothetical protein HUJ06_015691 [Nelumbo nucifera]
MNHHREKSTKPLSPVAGRSLPSLVMPLPFGVSIVDEPLQGEKH